MQFALRVPFVLILSLNYTQYENWGYSFRVIRYILQWDIEYRRTYDASNINLFKSLDWMKSGGSISRQYMQALIIVYICISYFDSNLLLTDVSKFNNRTGCTINMFIKRIETICMEHKGLHNNTVASYMDKTS